MLISFYDRSSGQPKCIRRANWPIAPNKGDSICLNSKHYNVVMVEHNIDLDRISVLMDSWGE